MEQNLLKSIIVYQKERFLDSKDLVERNILKKIYTLLESREVIFITGIRRSGKSSLMALTAKNLIEKKKLNPANILFINFEDERFINFSFGDFDKLFLTYLELENPKGRKYLFFDEIQNVEGWQRWINRLYEFEDVKIFISGSNASLLSSSASTALTGRNRQIKLFPFSFLEFLKLKGVQITEKDYYHSKYIAQILRLFNKYIQLGGFPEVIKNDDSTLIEQYFKDIIYRDIVSQYRIRNIKEIRELALYLISNTGAIASFDSLRKSINSKNISTVKNFITILKEVYLISSISLYDYSIKKQIYNPDKYYVNDIGFYRAVGFSFSDNFGKIMENIIYNRLQTMDVDLYYWKSEKGREVDFYFEANGIKTAIQVTYVLTPQNMEKEVAALNEIAEKIKVNEKIILTGQDEYIIENDIKVKPIWKWLLEE